MQPKTQFELRHWQQVPRLKDWVCQPEDTRSLAPGCVQDEFAGAADVRAGEVRCRCGQGLCHLRLMHPTLCAVHTSVAKR